MAKIQVNISPYEGEYEFDFDDAFTTLEWRWIKKTSGYMPLTINEGMKGGDPDVFVALAVIAMFREGKVDEQNALEVAAELAKAPFDGVAIRVVEDEVEDVPLSASVSPASNGESTTSSGDGSTTGSETSETDPTVIGTPPSDTSVSEWATSGV